MADTDQATARAAVMECEQEIQSIKAALRQLGAVDSGDPNSFEVVLLKVRFSSDHILKSLFSHMLCLPCRNFRPAPKLD
jgi:hypothetical protein